MLSARTPNSAARTKPILVLSGMSLEEAHQLNLVIPAEAGIHNLKTCDPAVPAVHMDHRLRGDDGCSTHMCNSVGRALRIYSDPSSA